MTDDREQAIADLYAAFNARDPAGVLGHVAPEVDWPNAAAGGTVHGRSALRDYLEALWREADTRIEPLRFDIGADGKVHVRVHQFVTAKDGTVRDDRKIEHVFAFDGPFVSRMDIIDRDPHPEDDEDEDD